MPTTETAEELARLAGTHPAAEAEAADPIIEGLPVVSGSGAAYRRLDLALSRLVAGRSSERPLLVASDFDGTIARLDLDPWAARVLPGARAALRRLAALDGVVVALVSGRAARDLAARVRVGGAWYLGDHGLERGSLARRQRAEHIRVEHAASFAEAAPVAERLAVEVPRLVPEAWLVVEAKIPAVAFHFRGAPDIAAAAILVRDAVERLDPDVALDRHPGRRVLELRPRGAPGKGEAMAWLLETVRPSAALMLGDDRHDARAFAVLRAARAARAADRLEALTVAVRAHPDSLPDVSPHADLIVDGPAQAARLLGRLAALATAAVPRARTGRAGGAAS
jgi:trehalose 6-phosphate phosphatase